MLNEVGHLGSVVVKHAREAFVDQPTVDAQWRALNFAAAPDFARAIDEYDRFVDILRASGAEVHGLPRDRTTTLDSIYVRDASIVTPAGIILCSMGKPARQSEPAAQERAYRQFGGPSTIAGEIRQPGRVEGGDLIWLDERTSVVGRGYRTNAEGIRQLRAIVADSAEIVEVPLPHWRGPSDVMHLMSLISPVDRDAAVVYSPLLPVPFRELLLERGYALIEVPDDEFGTMGCNVLALRPRRALIVSGNPRTRRALEKARVEVLEYEGFEISVKGAGGPTCLTRPLVRSG
jgi:N-dimethylarginine dimethylaminohydrolase